MFELVIEYLKGVFESNPAVKTIAHGVSNDIDLEKKNMYPLVHIQWQNMELDGQGINYTFDIHVLRLRDQTKAINNVVWQANQSEINNYSICSDIAIKAITTLRNTNNDITMPDGFINTLELVSTTSPEAVTLEYMNMLDGVNFQLTVQVNNTIGGC